MKTIDLTRRQPAIKVNVCFNPNLDLTTTFVETFEEAYKVHISAIKGYEVRSYIFAKISKTILACFTGLVFVILTSLKFLHGPYLLWGKADCGDLSDPTLRSTVEPEELVTELAFRGLCKQNISMNPFFHFT